MAADNSAGAGIGHTSTLTDPQTIMKVYGGAGQSVEPTTLQHQATGSSQTDATVQHPYERSPTMDLTQVLELLGGRDHDARDV